jgi:hypothetical protein
MDGGKRQRGKWGRNAAGAILCDRSALSRQMLLRKLVFSRAVFSDFVLATPVAVNFEDIRNASASTAIAFLVLAAQQSLDSHSMIGVPRTLNLVWRALHSGSLSSKQLTTAGSHYHDQQHRQKYGHRDGPEATELVGVEAEHDECFR